MYHAQSGGMLWLLSLWGMSLYVELARRMVAVMATEALWWR